LAIYKNVTGISHVGRKCGERVISKYGFDDNPVVNHAVDVLPVVYGEYWQSVPLALEVNYTEIFEEWAMLAGTK
jgi:hypothetical protein